MKVLFIAFLLTGLVRIGNAQDPTNILMTILNIEKTKLIESYEKTMKIDSLNKYKYIFLEHTHQVYAPAYIVRKYSSNRKVFNSPKFMKKSKQYSYINGNIQLLIKTFDWHIDSFTEEQRDMPMIKVSYCLFPTDKLEVGDKLLLKNTDMMELSFTFSKPPCMRGGNTEESITKIQEFYKKVKTINITYESGKKLEFTFTSELDYKLVESDLPKQEIVLDIEVK